MPVKHNPFWAVSGQFFLPDKIAVTALLWGIFFVVAPIPQLVVSFETCLLMLLSGFIGPVCGIIAMIAVFRYAGKMDALTLFKLNAEDLVYAVSGTVVIISVSGIVTALWRIVLLTFAIPFAENQYLMTLAGNCSSMEFALLAALVVLVVPVAEELLFRRVLFAWLLKWGNAAAWLGTAAIFAVVHLFLAGLPGLFVIGLGFQWLYIRRKNLSVSIVSHGLLNACALLSALLIKG